MRTYPEAPPRPAVEPGGAADQDFFGPVTRLRECSPTTTVADIPLLASTLDRVTDGLVTYARANRRRRVGLPVRLTNAYSLAHASRDTAYRHLMLGTGVNLPDGAPVAWAMKLLGRAPVQKVRGATLFRGVLERGVGAGLRHYFLGTTPETLELLIGNTRRRVPGVVVAGAEAPPMGPADQIVTESLLRSIAAARPDIVWVGLGSPKQDYVSRVLADRLGLPCVGIGAAFDFLAGTKPEAPALVQHLGLEWLHRLGTEPQRLWRRYAFGNARFLVLVARTLAGSPAVRPDIPAQ